MEVKIGMAKVPKFDYSESGDSLEVVERPRGGVSVIFADGQGSGVPAKRVSRVVVSKAVSLVADGARDGAVARAVHDYLHALKEGKVLSTLVIISVDAASRTLVVSRNGGPAVVLVDPDNERILDDDCPPIGVGTMVKPSVTEVPVKENLVLVAATDGITSAGKRSGGRLGPGDMCRLAREMGPDDPPSIARDLLLRAVELDGGRPGGDMTVMVLSLVADRPRPKIRRLNLEFPL